MKDRVTVTGVVLVCATSSVYAADKEKKSPWETSAELGYVETSGNTNTETLVFKFDTAYEIEKWKHQAHLEALNAKTDDVTTADKKLASAQSDFKFTPRDYFYGLISYEDVCASGRILDEQQPDLFESSVQQGRGEDTAIFCYTVLEP